MRSYYCWLLGVVVASSCIVASPSSDRWSQIPLSPPTVQKPWDALPNPEGIANLMFNALDASLQVWPNGRHNHGHTIFAASVAPGTVLYHGRVDSAVPEGAGWLATEPDHSYLFCNGVCHLLTFVTTRKLRLAYFDGASAAKMAGGTMDSQDILIWGEVDDGRCWNEAERIRDLCEWGKPYGIDGYVRMSIEFEIMTCDFSNGLQVVSNHQIVPTSKPHSHMPGRINLDPKIPTGWKGSIRTFASACSGFIEAGSWHYRSPGETRIKINYSKMFTFYDPVFTSLVGARRTQTRDEYRVANISAEDTKLAQAQVADIFTRDEKGSGIDWGSIVQVVVDRYSDRLAVVKHLLEHPGSRNVTAQAVQVRSQILTMLTPYMLTDVIPTSSSGSRSWVAPIAENCASTLTAWTPVDLITRPERLIKGAIDEVLHEICRVLSDIWVDAFGVEEASAEEASRYITKWRHDTDGLMAWLDWSIWGTCDLACGPEELCYTPMWPWVAGGLGSYPYGTAPRCIPRMEPFAPFLDV